jgi:L-ascorbate metabolism protein UlaG (beta-lactamase superfamily)
MVKYIGLDRMMERNSVYIYLNKTRSAARILFRDGIRFFSAALAVAVIGGCSTMNFEKFGENPKGVRLESVMKSSHAVDGEFRNLSETTVFTGSFFSGMKDFFVGGERVRPEATLPSRKADLMHLDPSENVVVWFGHSSYFLQLDGIKILIDPVLSGHGGPFDFMIKSFPGSDVYSAEDIPAIDYLLITHDHWDHLDYDTVKAIMPKVKCAVTGLGTGGHLEYWGYDRKSIVERDWYENAVNTKDISIDVTPARHFSGRLFSRNRTLSVSFVIRTKTKKVFVCGDSGYDTHFRKIGDTYGPFDLALMECGQYNPNWSQIHMTPEQSVQAAVDLRAKKMLPGHWGKFSLSSHSWDDPVIRASAEAAKKHMFLVHPIIGDPVSMNGDMATQRWWETVVAFIKNK